MTIMVNRDVAAELAHLRHVAEGAGEALGCPYQSSDELHHSMIDRYLNSQSRKRVLMCSVGAVLLLGLLFV